MFAFWIEFPLDPSPESDLDKHKNWIKLRKIQLLSQRIIILATKDLFFNEGSKINTISLYLPKAKRFLKVYAYHISNYTFKIIFK